MIHVDANTTGLHCDQCGADLDPNASDKARNAFLHQHGQCRKAPAAAGQEPR